jgi:hypothetical protein
MIRLSPRLLIATAGALAGLGAHPFHRAPGTGIEQLYAVHAGDAQAPRESWDAPLIQHCGYWAHFDYRSGRSAWPVPSAATVAELAAFGASRAILHSQPAAGDIFLQYTPRRRGFMHAGIVVDVIASGRYDARTPYYDLDTIEGDTDVDGRVAGGVTRRMTRRLSPASGDRFLRWAELETFDRVMRVVGARDGGRNT